MLEQSISTKNLEKSIKSLFLQIVFYIKLILSLHSELQNQHFSSGNALRNFYEAFSPRNHLMPLLLALRSCFFKNLHLKSLNLGDFLIKIDVSRSTRSASAAFLGRKCFVPLQRNKSGPETRYARRNFKNYMTFHLKNH